MMQLSKKNLGLIKPEKISVPSESMLILPERILQFGTGVLLRGLCDFFVHRANEQAFFNGRIVVIKSTESGDTDAFEEQDNLYTICSRGMNGEEIIEENIICSAISRVISARRNWHQVLELAHEPALQVIISNTTEVGLQLVRESIHQSPPSSYPAKLLAFLHRRHANFKGTATDKMVVVPTELITENGKKLKEIVTELAEYNQLDEGFMDWMNANIFFCNSLVDRIVTKDPGKVMLEKIQGELGYEDNLLTMCEDYRLWAIQGDAEVESILSFIQGDGGVFIKPDIEIYKSLKLHLLNGTHTFSAGLAFLAGFDIVKEAMADKIFSAFVEELMLKDIACAIPHQIPEDDKRAFGLKVLDRFRNPFLQHQWLNITLQNTTKMRMRNAQVIKNYHEAKSRAAICMAIGFSAYILFMRAVKKEDGLYYGRRGNEYYRIHDDHAPFFTLSGSSMTQ